MSNKTMGIDGHWLRTRVGVPAAAAVIAAVVVVIRATIGWLFQVPAHLITYLGIAGGALAGMVMVGVFELWTDPTEPDLAAFRVLQVVHVFYFTIAGGLYPAVAAQVLGLSGTWYAALPGAILVAVAWSEALFVVAVFGYLMTGVLAVSKKTLDTWLNMFLLFMLYGLVLGVVVGSWRHVWAPLFA